MLRTKNARKLHPVALYAHDRVFARTEAARLDRLPADIISAALVVYRQGKGNTPTAESVADDTIATSGKGVAS
jgi:hypothetical protein